MKTRPAILLGGALLATMLAIQPTLSVAQSPYADTYINKSSLQKEAERAKKQRELEEQRQRDYEKWYNEQQAEKAKEEGRVQQETMKKPEDFSSYAEYREYLDGLGQHSKPKTSQSASSQSVQQHQQSGSVVNNYYVNSQSQGSYVSTYSQGGSQQVVTTTTVVYDPFWDSPSVTMGLFFDPWYMTTYRVNYYPPTHYWYDPFWNYPWGYSYYNWNSPWCWGNSYNRGFRDGYIAGSYDYGYYPHYYGGGYYVPPTISIPREPTVYGVRRSSTSSMSGYGQVQRSATAQSARTQSNTDGYYRTSTVQSTRGADYMPTYTSPENGSSRHYNSSNASQQYSPRRDTYSGQTTRQSDRQYQNSQPTRNYNNYNNNYNNYSNYNSGSNNSTRTYTPQTTTPPSSTYNSSTPQTTRGGGTGSSNSGSGNSVQQSTRR